MKKFDWVIHYVANGILCDTCGKVESPFLEMLCDAHTHGLERYGHQNFQTVLNTGPKEIAYLLNTLGERVQQGERFLAGEQIEGLYLDCPVHLDEIPSDDGSELCLRLIIPDSQNRWPEDPKCEYPYNMQLLPMRALMKSDAQGGNCCGLPQ